MRKPSAMVALVSLAFSLGCASSGARSTRAFFSVDNTHKSLVAARDQVNRTAQSLQTVIAQSGDIQAAYKEFSRNVDRMNEEAREVEDRANEMRENRSAYLKQWSKESKAIQDEEIARLAASRQQEIEREFNALTESMAQAKQALEPYVQGLNDIRTYLKNDLTSTGLQNMKPVAERILGNGTTVNEILDQTDSALTEVSAALAPRS